MSTQDRRDAAILLGGGPDAVAYQGSDGVWQLSLFSEWDTTAEGRDLTARFWKYHHDNPGVYRELVALARQLKERGRNHYGIGGLFEVLRWHRALETQDAEGFKANNSMRSRYARLIAAQETDLADFFTTRELRSAAFSAERQAA